MYCQRANGPRAPWISRIQRLSVRASQTVRVFRRRFGTRRWRSEASSEIAWPSIHRSSQNWAVAPLPTTILVEAKKDVMLHVRELEIQSPPGPKGISSHTPNPANTQTDSQPGEVRDTQPTVEQRTATLSPVDMAVPGPLYVYLPF